MLSTYRDGRVAHVIGDAGRDAARVVGAASRGLRRCARWPNRPRRSRRRTCRRGSTAQDAPPNCRARGSRSTRCSTVSTTVIERLLQFSADLAHEMRTPIGVLIGQTQVTLARTRSSSEYQQVLESNLEELERLRHRAEHSVSRAGGSCGAGRSSASRSNCARNCERIAEYFEGLADERGMSFEVQAEGVGRATQSCAGAPSATWSSTRCVTATPDTRCG